MREATPSFGILGRSARFQLGLFFQALREASVTLSKYSPAEVRSRNSQRIDDAVEDSLLSPPLILNSTGFERQFSVRDSIRIVVTDGINICFLDRARGVVRVLKARLICLVWLTRNPSIHRRDRRFACTNVYAVQRGPPVFRKEFKDKRLQGFVPRDDSLSLVSLVGLSRIYSSMSRDRVHDPGVSIDISHDHFYRRFLPLLIDGDSA